MLEELYTFTSRINKSYFIAMPRLRGYLNYIQLGIERLIDRNDRFTNDPIPSGGIDYLNSLITRADINYLLRFKNDVERLTKVNHEYQSPAYGDFIRQYPIRSKNFTRSEKGSAAEFLLITDDLNIISNLPLGSNNFDDWNAVNPLEMLSNDSNEVLLDITTSRLKYKQQIPKEVVFSINIPKLLMVYTKYRLLYPEQFEENVNNYPFIFKVCLLPLLRDNVKNYIVKAIHDIVLMKLENPANQYDYKGIITGEKSHFLLGNMGPAFAEIEDLIQKCALSIVKPDEVINSIEIAPNISLIDEITRVSDDHYIGNRGAQFKWAEFEKEYYLLSTMVALYALQPNSVRTNELRKLFTIFANRLENARFWNGPGNPYVAKFIKNKFYRLTSYL